MLKYLKYLKQLMLRLIPSAMLGLSLLTALMKLLAFPSPLWEPLSVCMGTIVLFSLLSLNKRVHLIGWGLALAAAGVWLGAFRGLSLIQQTVNALYLQFTGNSAALPMFAAEAGIMLALIIGPVSVLLSKGSGCWFAMSAVLVLAVLCWLMNAEAVLLYLLPALVSALTLILLDLREGSSMLRVMPMITIAVAAAFIASGTGIVIQPLQDTARSLRQTIMDYLFFTEPRNVFSLSAEGYYPQGVSQLGGAASPSSHAVMEVTTGQKVYLRGTVKNEYTGRSWRDTTGGRRYQWGFASLDDQRSAIFNMALPSATLRRSSLLMNEGTVTVRMLSDSASSLFVPQRVRELRPGGSIVPYFNNASEIFATRDLQQGDTWTVTAPLTIAGDTGLGVLLEACAQADDPAYADILRRYTELPSHLEGIVFDLARDIASSGDTPYEKALAIQNHLQRSYRYTLDAAPQPADMDFVTNFLFNTKEGYCTYFASAMTVLCRMAGLPARYVEGYLAVPDENGTAYITGYDGHAWTEVYFSGFGWLTFDATPGSRPDGNDSRGTQPPPPDTQGGSNDDDHKDDQPEPSPEPSSEPDVNQGQDDDDNRPDPTPSPTTPPDNDTPDPERTSPDLSWLRFLLPLLLLLAFILRIILMMPEHREKKLTDPDSRLELWLQAMGDALAVQKVRRDPSVSPITWLDELEQSGRFPFHFTHAIEWVALKYYGGHTATDEGADNIRSIRRLLWGKLTRMQKLKLLLVQAFVPLKKRSIF